MNRQAGLYSAAYIAAGVVIPPPAYHIKCKAPCTNKQRAPTWQQAGRYCSATVEQSPLRSQAQQAWRSVLGSLLAQQASSALGPCQHVE